MKLTIKQIADKLGVKPKTVKKYFENSDHPPEIEYVGRSPYVDEDDFYRWIETFTDKPISKNDRFLKSNEVMEIYGKSYTWLWYVVKRGELAKPFTINRTNFWLEKEVTN